MIQPATAHHAPALALIHAAAFPRDGRFGPAWGADALGLQFGLPGAFGFVSGAPGGFVLARVAADEAEILTLAVLPEARRRGLARALLQAAMAEAAALGAAAMLLEVGEANAAARALYHGAGFLPVGRRRAYYAGREDALVLRCPLTLS